MLAALDKLDGDLSRRFRLPPAHPLARPAALLAHTGDSWVWAALVALVWALRIGGPSWQRLSAILLVSIIFQALFVFFLKKLIRRQRPPGAAGSLYRTIDPHSFPSGHATRAIMLAVLAIALGPPWFGWAVGIWAPLVCLSRVATGVHYLSDILGGMLLGLLLGLAIVPLVPLWETWLPFLFPG